MKARLKRVMYELRMFSSWNRRNNTQTGGGFPEKMPKEIRIAMTGPLMSLHGHYGATYFNGLTAYDCDNIGNEERSSQQNICDENTPLIKYGDSDTILMETAANEEVVYVELNTTPTEASTDSIISNAENESTIHTQVSITTAADNAATDMLPAAAATTVTSLVSNNKGDAIGSTTRNTASSSKRENQFFGTSDQRRRYHNRPENCCLSSTTAQLKQEELVERRRQFLEDIIKQNEELHSMRKAAIEKACAAHIAIWQHESELRIADMHHAKQQQDQLFEKKKQFWNLAISSLPLQQALTPPSAEAAVNVVRVADVVAQANELKSDVKDNSIADRM